MPPISGGPGGGGPPPVLLLLGLVPPGFNTSTYFDLRPLRLLCGDKQERVYMLYINRQDVLCTYTCVHVTQKHLGESFDYAIFKNFATSPPPKK